MASVPPAKSIRILLVAGHEPHYGGAVYRDRFERDMTVQLSQFLVPIHHLPTLRISKDIKASIII